MLYNNNKYIYKILLFPSLNLKICFISFLTVYPFDLTVSQ